MEVGKLTKNYNPETGKTGYVGRLDLPQLAGRVALAPREKRGEGSPDWTLMIWANGAWRETGQGWTKIMKSGEEFFSIKVDNPGMDRPVNVSAFTDGRDGEERPVYQIVWTRPRGGGAAAQPAAAGVGNDAIPY